MLISASNGRRRGEFLTRFGHLLSRRFSQVNYVAPTQVYYAVISQVKTAVRGQVFFALDSAVRRGDGESGGTPLQQLIPRHPEHAFDAGGIADAYLDMGSRAETGPFISRLAFHEDPAHGVYG